MHNSSYELVLHQNFHCQIETVKHFTVTLQPYLPVRIREPNYFSKYFSSQRRMWSIRSNIYAKDDCSSVPSLSPLPTPHKHLPSLSPLPTPHKHLLSTPREVFTELGQVDADQLCSAPLHRITYFLNMIFSYQAIISVWSLCIHDNPKILD